MGFWLWPFEVFELVGLMEKLRASLAQRLVQCPSIDCQWETYLMGLNQLEWPSWWVKRLWIIAPPMPSKLYCHYSGATKHQHSAAQSYPKMMYLLQRVDRLLFFLGDPHPLQNPPFLVKKNTSLPHSASIERVSDWPDRGQSTVLHNKSTIKINGKSSNH